jgi:hypothetical protein
MGFGDINGEQLIVLADGSSSTQLCIFKVIDVFLPMQKRMSPGFWLNQLFRTHLF